MEEQSHFMIVFSTVLDIDGRPTLYNVYKNRGLAFLSPSLTCNAPILYAACEDSIWKVRGTNDVSIQRQVMNEIDNT